MDATVLEVKKGVLHSYDGEPHEVEGGAYLSPEAYLRTAAELERGRERQLLENGQFITGLIFGSALLGLAAGFWLGRRSGDDD
jgi:hypothetical protein